MTKFDLPCFRDEIGIDHRFYYLCLNIGDILRILQQYPIAYNISCCIGSLFGAFAPRENKQSLNFTNSYSACVDGRSILSTLEGLNVDHGLEISKLNYYLGNGVSISVVAIAKRALFTGIITWLYLKLCKESTVTDFNFLIPIISWSQFCMEGCLE